MLTDSFNAYCMLNDPTIPVTTALVTGTTTIKGVRVVSTVHAIPVAGSMILGRSIINPQAHEHREQLHVTSLWANILLPPMFLANDRNDVQFLGSNACSYGNVMINHEKLRLSGSTTALQKVPSATFLRSRFHIGESGTIIPKTFRDNRGEASTSSLAQ